MTISKWSEKVSFIWSVKEILRDHYKRHQYGAIILPLCVVRRLDCVLEPSKSKVVERAKKIKGDVDAHFDLLCSIASEQFYNTSPFSFETLLDDTDNIAANFIAYINGFSPNVRDVIAKFDLLPQVDRLESAEILGPVLARFKMIDLHPDAVSDIEMGYIYEELIRVTADLSNEEAGEHFTPREVIRLMVNLLLTDERSLLTPSKIFKVLDPACGTGGMLSETEARIDLINSTAKVYLYGQEVNPESYAVCRSDMMLKGQDASHIVFGSSFSADGHKDETFDYILANPPYGKDWKTEQKFIDREAKLGFAGRFGAGLPPTSDGQLLFVQHMVSKMRRPEDGGSRIAVVLNGSPLFSGDAGSGPSEIRRWLIENDWLEAIIGLPDQMFYNTGIFTYIWVISNRKRPERQGHVLLVDAREVYTKMRKTLGNKRKELTNKQITTLTSLYEDCSTGERTRVVPNKVFGYHKITVERPLQLRFEPTEDKVEEVLAQTNIAKLKGQEQAAIHKAVTGLIGWACKDRDEFVTELKDALRAACMATPAAAVVKTIWSAIGEHDAEANIVTNSKGEPEADPALRDTEKVPLTEDIEEYFAREVLPHVPDAWIDHDKTKIGYEIPFTRHFYRYIPPRPLEEIQKDLRVLVSEIQAMEQLIATLREDRTATITHAVTKGLDPDVEMFETGSPWVAPNPSTWMVKKLKRDVTIRTGFAFASESFTDTGIPVLRIGDILPNGTVDLGTAKYLPPETLTSHKRFVVKGGEIVMAMTGATTGKPGRLPPGAVALLNQRVCTMSGRSRVLDDQFLWYLINSQPYQRYVAITAFGGAQPNISDTELTDFTFALPPIDEQRRITAYLDSETVKIDALVEKSAKMIEALREYRSALITDAVTGRIDVREEA
jgi:type I restriction enzyme M protein